jgi:5-(carboxyamino)imidazole ribonucleotide synthase
LNPLGPGATIGILGGGQLGRMMALAAAKLGYHCHIYCPESASPAAEVSAAVTVAGYDDEAALDRFAAMVDVVTYEFENVPAETVRRLAAAKPVRPGVRSLEVAQDRCAEKSFALGLGIETARFATIDRAADLTEALGRIGRPAILKTRRLGYDGKGQVKIGERDAPEQAWAALGGQPAILEARVPFERELSVIVARAEDGAVVVFPPVENRHVGGILDLSLAPAAIDERLAGEAASIGERIAAALGHVGVLCAELFVAPGGRLLLNEIAPRVHNSGHWTIEACVTSQFEQHVRAVVGLPLGSTARLANAAMKNLIGPEGLALWPKLAHDPAAKLHLYGKSEARPGRKMGHVTWLWPLDQAPRPPDLK